MMVLQGAATPPPRQPEEQPRAARSAIEGAKLSDLLLELTPSGVALLDAVDLTVLFANAAFHAMALDPELDPVGCTVEEIWPSEDGLELRSLVEGAAETGEATRCEW
ncbi:MAG TPA: PAS domain-containing protein, partial [Anaeromyxobacteraceae bacterium]